MRRRSSTVTSVNDVARLADGQVLYTSVLNEDGGMLDDLTLVRLVRATTSGSSRRRRGSTS